VATKSPKLALRQSCVQDLTRDWSPSRFLEMGAGRGYMARLFLDRGFSGVCFDLSPQSRAILRESLGHYGDQAQVVDDTTALVESSFDYLLVFEVLEHVEEDQSTLRDWTRYLKPGGRLAVSVPAHRRKFSKSDEIVGHLRRYEKAELLRLLRDSGYRDIEIVNYGFPLTAISRRLSNAMLLFERQHRGLSVTERSLQSSYTRPSVASRGLSLVNERLYRPFFAMQRLFYRWDLGDGLVAQGVRAE
jgi:SAM-dependent methyltransferase